MRALIDADSITWAAAAVSKGHPLSHALHAADNMINKIINETNCPDHVLYISPPKSFRNDLYPDYKANRKNQPQPEWKDETRQHLIDAWDARCLPNLEADDCLSIAQHAVGYEDMLCSIDKDLWTVHGWHYSWRNSKGVHYVDEDQASYEFYKQVLTGDRADNIKGLPNIGPKVMQTLGIKSSRGCGEKTAEKILDGVSPENLAYATHIAYSDYHGDVHEGWMDMYANGCLLHMTRELLPDGTPKLWEPPDALAKLHMAT